MLCLLSVHVVCDKLQCNAQAYFKLNDLEMLLVQATCKEFSIICQQSYRSRSVGPPTNNSNPVC